MVAIELMKKLALIACLALFGCGGTPTTLEGNWNFQQSSMLAIPPGFSLHNRLRGTFEQQGNRLNGVFASHSGAFCADFNAVFLKGSVLGREVELTGGIAREEANTITIHGTFVPENDSFYGTYVISDPLFGCEDEGFFAGRRFAKPSGEWSGTAVGVYDGSLRLTVTAALAQGLDSSSDPWPPISGKVTFAGSDCFNSGEFRGFANGSEVVLSRSISETDFTSAIGEMSDSETMAVNYFVRGGPCDGTRARGTLKKVKR
jgi:hypothetical protein